MRHPSFDERFDPAVRIVGYDPAWAELAAAEIGRIEVALAGVALRVEHVGSTAVPGSAAKPIIDLLVAVASIEPRARYVEPLEGIGYLFASAPESPDFHFFGKPPARPAHSHHLHICVAGSEDEIRHLALRDFLRAHPDEVARYAARKREVVARHPQDRPAYIEGKADYVAALEQRAVAWAHARVTPS